MAFLELFLTFFMIGIVTFGGGYAMLPMIQEQVGLRWNALIPPELLINFVAVSESTPGPFAINMATYVGSVVGGDAGGSFLWSVLGSACSTLGVVVPSFVIILLVANFYDKFKQSRIVKGCMTGLKPAVVGLIANAVLNVVLEVFSFNLEALKNPATYVSLGIFGVMTFLGFKKVHPIIIVVLSAVAGIIFGYVGWL